MEAMEIGPLRLYPFGAAVALALGVGAAWSWKRAHGAAEKKAAEVFWLLAPPLGLILAHLAWCLCSLDMIEDEFWEIFMDFAGGGYMLYGALAGAAAAGALACRMGRVRPGRLADLMAEPFLIFGAGCALGEGIIGAGCGWKVEDWFLAENSMSLLGSEEPEGLVSFFSHFPFAVRDGFYGYASWAVFLPMGLFLTAGAWYAARRLRTGWPGSRGVFCLSLYAAVRVLYESLRQDDIPKWGFVRANQILSAALLLLLMGICVRRRRGEKAHEGTSSGPYAGPSSGLTAGPSDEFPAGAAAGAAAPGRKEKGLGASLALFAGGAALVMMMEFALEKKIGFLEWMTMDLCYLVSGVGCWMLFRSVNRLRKV